MAGFREFVEELLEPLSGTAIRRMFGGYGVFRDGIMFGILDDGVLYLRVDETTQPRFEAERSEPFVYESMGRSVTMPYWRVPDWLFEEADAFREWAQASFAAARRAKKARTTRPAAVAGVSESGKEAKPSRRGKAAGTKSALPKRTRKIRRKSDARA
jgi:DNA transformation protein